MDTKRPIGEGRADVLPTLAADTARDTSDKGHVCRAGPSKLYQIAI